MAFTGIQKTTGGAILKTTGGGIQESCCCNASSCIGNEPELLRTVTGASGTINWGSQTWVLPGESGVQKTACPTLYQKFRSQQTNVFPSTTFFPYTITTYKMGGREQWKNDKLGTGGVSNQSLLATYKYEWTKTILLGSPSHSYTKKQMIVDVLVTRDSYVWSWIDGVTSLSNSTCNINANCGATTLINKATPYLVPLQTNGTHTVGGITYAWQQGAGW